MEIRIERYTQYPEAICTLSLYELLQATNEFGTANPLEF